MVEQRRIWIVALAAAALVAGTLSAQAAPGHSATAARPDAVQIHPGIMKIGRVSSKPPTTAFCEAQFSVTCYGANQIEQAYDLPDLYSSGTSGQGQTIVIVDSFGSPTIKHDLKVFDKAYNIPDPPSIKVIQPAGAVHWKANPTDEGWAGETTLDVEYAHTIAPGANILLVETPVSEEEGTTGFPQIVKAEKYVINNNLGGVISQSFSATEQTFPTAQSLFHLRGAYTLAAKKGVTVLAATGDSGAADTHTNEIDYYLHPVTSWPDSDPLVTGVGGTQLRLDADGNHTSPDVVWNETYDLATQQFVFGDDGPNPLAGGGGQSVIFDRPSYQNSVRSVVGNQRGVPDISMSGACNGAVITYQSYAGSPPGWYPACGTSEATPLFAGIVALADQAAGHTLGNINPALYVMSAHKAPGIVDVRAGDTTVSFPQNGTQYTVQGAVARPGYDLASGVGTVDAKLFVPELAAQAG